MLCHQLVLVAAVLERRRVHRILQLGAKSRVTRPRIRRLFRISLRTMLLVMAVLCILLGLKARQMKKQQAAIAAVRKAGGSVTYAYQVDEEAEDIDYDANPPGPDWLCGLGRSRVFYDRSHGSARPMPMISRR